MKQTYLPIRNQEACLWAVFWAAYDEWLYYNADASDAAKADARTAIMQSIGLMDKKK